MTEQEHGHGTDNQDSVEAAANRRQTPPGITGTASRLRQLTSGEEAGLERQQGLVPPVPALIMPAALSPLQQRHRVQTLDRAAALFRLCEPFGGVLMGQEVVDELRHSHSQPLSLLARWIVDRKVAQFTWRAAVFLPRFQFLFERPSLRMHWPVPGMQTVLSELDEVFDECEQIEWFATPNTWLELRVPAIVITTNAAVVAEAARADRHIARGW